MCGIFGYVGSSRSAAEAVIEGLRKLDYRGYDSWGVATLNDGDIEIEKQVGVVARDSLSLGGVVAIGHTRWATHGAVTEKNAHPHHASDRSFALAHNGIVENADELRVMLQNKGYTFISETDTETIVYLVEEQLKKKIDLKEAVRRAFKELKGRNTIIVLSRDGQVVGARNGSPLVVGLGKKAGEIYFSSDVLSFSSHVDKIIVLENGQMVAMNGALSLCDIASGKSIKLAPERNAIVGAEVDKGSYEHYMLKEINESPFVVRQLLKESDKRYRDFARAVKAARNVYCIGSGTAGAAAAQMAYYLRVYGGIRATALIGAEASDYYKLFGKGDLLIAPSQSGETADVLEVLETAKKRGAKIASFVNMPGSMMTRMSDYPFMAQAGPEICVMSTKIFVSQIAWGYLVAKAVGGKLAEGKRNLSALARAMETFLKDPSSIESIDRVARTYATKEHIFLLGKGQNTQIIKEGMVKIIEGAYRHAHGIPAGDLKHYAITLMEEGTPVLVVVSDDALRGDVLNAVHEVGARGASVIGIAPEKAEQFVDWIKVPNTKETSAIMNVIPLQLLAYRMSVALGNNVDKPRNIAKSVTVR